MVKAGKARFQHKRGIRYIVLFRSAIPKLKNATKLQLRIDPGAGHTGIAVTRDDPGGSRTVIITIELPHRGKDIKQAMIKRAQKRRNRRCRKTRYRKPRFKNRARPADWLPPSLRSRLTITLTWVLRLSRLLPIDSVHVETNVFDPQLIRNPNIKGVEYQQGPLYQTNLRAAVLQRDDHQCTYCGFETVSQNLT